jgi:hypothetical protein
MGLDKISVTLYDLIGYLVPGYVLLLVLCLIEATFLSSSLFALTRVANASVPALILAYFLGHVSHGLGAWVKLKKPSLFRGTAYALNPDVRRRVVESLKNVYGLDTKDEDLSRLDVYLLADNYILAKGGSVERDILTAREGFFKASMTAFTILAIAILLTLLSVPRFQTSPGIYIVPSKVTVATLTAGSLLLVWLFRKRFIFFNSAKNNNALLTFLALTVQRNS